MRKMKNMMPCDWKILALGFALFVSQGAQAKEFSYSHNEGVFSLAVSPDGRYLATGSKDRETVVWDLKENKESFRYKFPGSNPFFGDPVCKLAFSPSGDLLLVQTLEDGVILGVKEQKPIVKTGLTKNAYFISNSELLLQRKAWGSPLQRFNFETSLSQIVWNEGEFNLGQPKDGLFPIYHDSQIEFFDGLQNKIVHSISLKANPDHPDIRRVAFSGQLSPNGLFAAEVVSSGTSKTSVPPEVRLIDLKSGLVLKTFLGGEGDIWSKFSPSGRYLGVYNFLYQNAQYRGLKGFIYDVVSQKVVLKFPKVRKIDFSSDDKLAAIATDDETVALINVEDGKIVHSFHHNGYISVTGFFPDGSGIVTGGSDKKVTITKF